MICLILIFYEILQNLIIVRLVYMMREKSRLPPSPKSRHAKKPLISLETARTYSLDRMKK